MFINYIRKLSSILSKNEKRKLIFMLLLMMLGSLAEMASIGALPAFIALVAKPELLKKFPFAYEFINKLGIYTQNQLLIWGAISLILIFILKNAYLGFLAYYKANVVFNIQIRMSSDLFKSYLNAPYTFHLERNSSTLLGTVYDCIKTVITGVIMPFLTMIMESLLLISIMGLLIFVEPMITIITFGIFGSAGYLYLKLTKNKSINFGKELQSLRNDLYRMVTEGLVGFKDAHVLNRVDYFIKQFNISSNRNAKGAMHQSYISNLTKPVLETMAIIFMLSISIALVLRKNDISSILPSIALFGFASVRMMPSINQILASYSSLYYSFPSINPIWQDIALLKNEKIKQDRIFDVTSQIELNHEIEFKNVSYQYPEAVTESLTDINLKITAGKAIAFVGSSGAGKTTIVDVLLGLLQPTNGQINIDGKNIHINIPSWQKQIGYIPQQVFLSDNTIRNNIAFGIADSEIDNVRVNESIRLAQLETLVNELPEGIYTNIGERGVRFSGGQRQRIGIARALYHNPKVLIMDEATSALDNITEKNIVEEIEALKRTRTVIIIAHRLTTVMNCDLIYFMNNGKIIDHGTYHELIEKNIEFKKMALVV